MLTHDQAVIETYPATKLVDGEFILWGIVRRYATASIDVVDSESSDDGIRREGKSVVRGIG